MTCTLQVSASTTAHLGWADIPSYPVFSIENYVTGGNSYTSNGNETLSALTLITGAQSSGVTPGAGLEASGNISLDFSKTPDSASLSDVTILHMGRLFAGSGVNVTQAETLYQTGSVSGLQTSSLTVSGATVKVAGTRHDDSPSDNRVGASGHPEFSFETKRSSAKQSNADNASLRSTLGATGDVKFQNQSTLILGKGSHLLSQTGSIAFDEYSTFVIDESVSQDGFGTVSGNDALVWSHGQILAKNTSNYVASSTGNVWIETHIGDIDWQGKEFNARLVSDSGILNGSGNISIVTLQRTEDKTHNSGAISLTNGSVESAYKDKNGKVTLAANGTLNKSGIALNNTKVLGNTVVLVANADLKGTDDQALKSLSNAQNNILDLSNGAHIGKLGVTGEPQDSNEQATESLTIYADAVLNDRSGGEATNITVKGGVSLDETTSGDYASHLIAQNKLDIDASDKDVSIQNGAYLQTTGTDEAGITIEANAVNMGTTGDKTGSSISTGGGKVSVTAGSISMGTGSLLGNESTGNVELTSSSITLNSDSHINSSGEVKIVASEGNDLSISMDKQTSPGQNPSSIKGYKVTIGDDQRGGTFIEGGSIASSGEGVEISGGISKEGGTSGVVVNESIISTDEDGSVEITAAADAPIQIGTEKDGENIDKDTQIIGGNITIGSADGDISNDITVNDAVIGTVGNAGAGNITINAGSGKVDVTGSTVGTGSQDGSTSAAGKVEIAGEEVSIGALPEAGSADDVFDTSIGGSEIVVGGGNTGSVTVGDAQIGSGSQGGQSGSNVTIEVGNNGEEPGKITIGSAGGSTDTSISGGSVTIGSATDGGGNPQGSADITIAGNRNPENSNNSTTTISGDKVTIGNGTSDVSLEGTNVVSDGDSDSDGIHVAVGGNGKLNITDSILDATGSLPNGEVGTGSATGNVTISGPTGEKQGTIEDSQIASGGDVDFSGNLNIADSDIEAGAGTGSGKGSVNFGATEGDKGTVNITGGSTITGDGMSVGEGTSVNLGDQGDDADTDNRIDINNGGEIKVEGSLNIAGDNHINGAGDLTVNTGENGTGTVNVAEGGSITAGSEAESPTGGNLTISGNGTVNVNGGKLEANANGETGGNVVVESGDVNLSDGGSIVADGTVTVGNDQEGSSGASVNVGAGESGTIVAGGKNEHGNNLIVTGDGVLNVGNDGLGAGDVPQNQGSLVVTTDPDASVSPNPEGGLTIGSGTNVSVSGGGYVSSSDITFEEADEGGSAGRLEIANGGGIYTSVDTILDNAGNEESGLVFDKTEGSEFEVQISGTVSAEKDENGKSQLDQIRDIIGGSSLVVDHIEGLDEGVIIDKDQLKDDYSSAVVGDAVIDVSGNGDNSLGFGGGGSIMVDQNEDGNGQLTIKNPADGEENTGVVITGSETDPSKEIVVGAGADADNNGQPDPVTDGKYDIALEDGADLTLGKDGSAGGTLSGSITATTSGDNEGQSSDVTVNGGNFTVEGSIDLTHGEGDADDDGDIIIRDHNTSNPDAENGLTVAGDVNAGNLEMGGGDTNFDVNGKLDLSGNATLAGNADMDIVGEMNVGGDLDLSGTSSLGKGEQSGEGSDANLKVEGNLGITDSANVDRDNVDVNGNAHINGNGGLKTEGDFDVAGELQIGTGTDIQGGETDGGNPKVNVSSGNLTTGSGNNGEVSSGDLTVGQGTVTVTGEAGSDSEGNIIVGSTELGGDLVVGSNNDALKTPANVSADNDITVSNGNATIYDNGHVSAGGSFDVAATGNDDGNATIEGSLTANDADIDNNLTIGKADGVSREPNGFFVTEGSTSVGGDVIVNANGELSVGMNPSQADEGNLKVGGSFTTGTDSNVDIGGDLSVEGTAQIAGSVDVDGKGTFDGGLTIADGGHYNDESGNDFVLGDDEVETEVTGNLTVGETAPEGEDDRIGATANLGDVTVSGTTELYKGTVTAGDFTGHGDFKADAGSNFTAQGDLQLSEKDSSGAPDLIVNGGFVSAEAVGEGADATGGNIDVAGNISVSSNGSVSADGDIKAGGYVDVSSGSLTADGKLTVSGNNDAGLGLIIGDEDAQPSEDGSYEKTSSVTVGSVAAENKTQIWGNGTLTVGGEAQFTGGLAMGPGADYVNNSDEQTTVGGGLTLDAGASVVTNGSFVLGEEIGNKVGTSASPESGTLNGTISAGSIDFGSYENASNQDTITFEGGSTGTDGAASRFEAGFETGSLTGNVALRNGANAVLTPGADGSAPTVSGFITVNAGSKDAGKFGNTLTTNSANKGVYSGADVEQGNSYDAVINLDSSIQFTGNNSGLIVGGVDDSEISGSGVYFGDNSTLVIDASNMTSGSALFADSEGNSLGIDYVGADEGAVSVDLSGWLMGTSGSLAFDVAEEDEGKFDFTSSNVLQDFVISDGQISMQVKSIGEVTGGTLDGDLQDVVHNVTANGGNNYVSRAFNALFSSGTGAYGTLTEDGKFTLTGTGNQAAREIATFPVTAGAFNATYDYLTEFNRAVESRAQEKRIGDANNAVWAQVIATYNKSDELFSDASGYKADLYGGVLGTDVRLGNGTLIGGALTVGTGDIESRGAVIGTKNDATFYGLSVYAQHDIGLMSLKGDVTYLRTENDIAGTFEGVNMGGSMDSDAVSLGVRAEFAAYSSDTFEVKPHIGLRYTNYSFDDYNGTEIDDVNALEAPIGVAFSGKVQAKGGWTVVPELDLSVVPQLGDKEASVVNAGAAVDQRVLEGAVFNAKIGLGMQKDNFTFGANFQHGAGGFSRNNNAFQAFARWTF